MTRSWDDERIADLVEKCGLEGYGFYFRLLEIVAANIEGNSDAVVTYSIQRWSKLTAIFQPKVKRLCQVCAELELIEFELSEKNLKVSIPKIFKYRDEHTRKQARGKRKTPERLRTNSGQTPEQELELDIDIETDIYSKKPFTGKTADQKIINEWANKLGVLTFSETEKMAIRKLNELGCIPDDACKARTENPKYFGKLDGEHTFREISKQKDIRINLKKHPKPIPGLEMNLL